jgi:hypothetical protein
MTGLRSWTRDIAIAALFSAFSALPAAAQTGEPSRAPVEGCAWERLSDEAVGLALWAQRCDFGDRKIEFVLRDGGLWVQYSDGREPWRTIEVFDIFHGETIEAGLRRIFDERTDPAIAARCVLTPDTLTTPPAGVLRYTFVLDTANQAEGDADAAPDDVPEPPCGDYGYPPDAIDYFEVQPDSGANRVLFVTVGQDEPLFDDATLRILPDSDHAEVTPPEVPCCTYDTGEGGITADFLLETCSVPGQTAYGMIPFFDCQSYVMGLIDSARTNREADGDHARICLPPAFTASDALRLLEGQYNREQEGERRASDLLLTAMEAEYHCSG